MGKYWRYFTVLFLLASVQSVGASGRVEPPARQEALHRHIKDVMPLSVCEPSSTANNNFALPKPYSVPCTNGGFRNMFYWDTYFTNAGLLLDGDTEQALNNIENIAYMIDSIGYMPNATSKDLLNRSQPPLFCQMVKVEKARAFDPFGHAGFDPSGKTRLTP